VTLTYTVLWDIDLPAGRLRDHGLKTRGWTIVSAQNQHLDVYGVVYTPEIWRMGEYLDRDDLKRLAAVMYRTCGQMIDPWGSTGEQIQQTNVAQQGDMSHVFRLRGGYSENWTVFWITAHVLNVASEFERMGVDLDEAERSITRTSRRQERRDPASIERAHGVTDGEEPSRDPGEPPAKPGRLRDAMTMHVPTRWAALICSAALCSVSLNAAPRRPLTDADIEAIAQLVRLEDTRHFDEALLGRFAQSAHPEVRRRAVLAIGRIADPRGRPILVASRADGDAEVATSVVFAVGQLTDLESVPWLSNVLSSPSTTPAIAREAAQALGKIRSADARTALAQYLARGPSSTQAVAAVGEALLAIGRFTTPADLAPIVRWTTSQNAELRWRAAWALFRLRDPAAYPELLRLSEDPSAEVRFWAVRGLAPIPPPPANQAGAAAQSGRDARGEQPPAASAAAPAAVSSVAAERLAARLRDAVRDADRRVRTEALRALGQYDDDASFAQVLAALDAPDTWLSVSAAEALGRFKSRARAVVPRLTVAAGPSKPTALRVTALTPLATFAPEVALDVATALVRDPSVVARGAAIQTLQRLGEPGRARLDQLRADPATRDVVPQAGHGQAGAPAPAAPSPAVTPLTDADYRRIVERWVVPDVNGASRPHAVWETPRGTIELELYPGDAPLAMEYFVRAIESGAIVGTEFGRVVPNFVAQQRTIRDAPLLRDEVNRHGLTRANLSWASAGLDTGRPGFTLGSTPQPHNEGNFTALGRVVAGMDVVDRLELGDAVTAARLVR